MELLSLFSGIKDVTLRSVVTQADYPPEWRTRQC